MRTERNAWSSLVGALPGKKMPGAVYLHASAVDRIPESLLQALYAAQQIAGVDGSRYDVVKFSRERPTISLLAYPSFFEEAFPRLTEAWTVDLVEKTCGHRGYPGNPPILHRKETMLPAGHPAIPRFAELTREAERHGLFSDASQIGNAAAWQTRLRRLGLRVRGHSLVRAGGRA